MGNSPAQADRSSAASARPRWAGVVGIAAIAFGLLTVLTGGLALFGGAEARPVFGNVVGFVLWFNFLSGFAYMLAGAGAVLWKRWAGLLSAAIAVATLIIFVVFGWHVAAGNAFEMRTVAAMTLRSGFWMAVAFALCRLLPAEPRGSEGSH